jgi:hypothetical protein
MNKRRLAGDLLRHLLFRNWEYVHLSVHVCIQTAKILAKHSYLHPSIICHKVSKLHPIFSKSLKTIAIISAKASTAHQEQLLHNTTWEVNCQMLLECQARNNHIKVTQGNATELIYSWVRSERQLYK